MCAPLVQRCSAEYHRDLLHRAKRVNAQTASYWDERLCGMVWMSCAGCGNGMCFTEVRR